MTKTNTKKKTESLPEKDMGKFLDKAIRQLLIKELYGIDKECRVGLDDLHNDGRIAKKYARILCEAGYLAPVKNSTKTFWIQRAVTGEFNVDKPDLIGMLKANEYELNNVRRSSGGMATYGQGISTGYMSDDGFTSDQIAYILFNHEEFEFGFFGYGDYTEHAWGTEPKNDRYGRTIVVSSGEYNDFVYELCLGERIKSIYNQNIAWGLKELCGVSEDDASLMSSGDSSGVYIPSRTFNEEKTERDWAEIHRNGMTNSENALAFHTRKLEALHRIQIAVAKYGGWEKFSADYRQRIEDHVRKADAEEENNGE